MQSGRWGAVTTTADVRDPAIAGSSTTATTPLFDVRAIELSVAVGELENLSRFDRGDIEERAARAVAQAEVKLMNATLDVPSGGPPKSITTGVIITCTEAGQTAGAVTPQLQRCVNCARAVVAPAHTNASAINTPRPVFTP